jgi:hypothetical protein
MAKRPEMKTKLQEIAGRAGVTVPWDRITVNRWKPDTCGCVIEQWFDDDDPGVIDYAFITKACPAHPDIQALSDHAKGRTRWEAITGENTRKNAAIGSLNSILAEDFDDTATRVVWNFDDLVRLADGESRLLEIEVSGINAQVGNQLQSVLDIRFGPGQIQVARA